MPNQPQLNPDAVTLINACKELYESKNPGRIWEELPSDAKDFKLNKMRKQVSAYLAAALPEVTSVEQWDALPIGTMVRVHFGWNSELIIRCPAGSGAGIGSMSFLGGRHWSDVFTVWNSDKLEIKYIPEVNDA